MRIVLEILVKLVLVCSASQAYRFLVPRRLSTVKWIMSAEDETKATVQFNDAGMKYVALERSQAKADVYTLGANVASYRSPEELLFLLPDGRMDGSLAIQGGIAVAWPSVENGAGLDRSEYHSITESINWTILAIQDHPNPSVTLHTINKPETVQYFDGDFELTYNVTLYSDRLRCSLTVTNPEGRPLSFQAGIRPHIAVSDIDDAAVRGRFTKCRYFEYLDDHLSVYSPSETDVIVIDDPINRVYLRVKPPVNVTDSQWGRKAVISHPVGFSDIVIWNPYEKDDRGYRRFVSVQPSVVDNRVVLNQGESWTGIIEVAPDIFEGDVLSDTDREREERVAEVLKEYNLQ